MRSQTLTAFLGRVKRSRAGEVPDDGALLDRFLLRGDESAFEELVRRHGPMVLAVCRRVLRHEPDAEDAFQATFLLLACKGGTVWPRQQVGAWLHGAAWRSAAEARRAAQRRRRREQIAGRLRPLAVDPSPPDELGSVLD